MAEPKVRLILRGFRLLFSEANGQGGRWEGGRRASCWAASCLLLPCRRLVGMRPGGSGGPLAWREARPGGRDEAAAFACGAGASDGVNHADDAPVWSGSPSARTSRLDGDTYGPRGSCKRASSPHHHVAVFLL